MRTSNLVALLIPGLLASAASAQELVIPDRQRLQSMSHEEYGAYREQMRNRMDGLNPVEQNLLREPGVIGREQMENRNNGYGQGYGSRDVQGTEKGGMGGHGGGYGKGGGRRR